MSWSGLGLGFGLELEHGLGLGCGRAVPTALAAAAAAAVAACWLPSASPPAAPKKDQISNRLWLSKKLCSVWQLNYLLL